MDINELKKQEEELKILLAENIQKQRELNSVEFCKENGINVGDIVEWESHGKKIKGIVSGFDYSGKSPWCYLVTLFNENGVLGKRERRLWGDDLFFAKVKKQ